MFYFKALDPDFDGDIGRNVLSKVTPSAGGTVYWPVYLFNLTAIPQATTNVQPFFRLSSTGTANMLWVTRNGQDNGGVTSANLMPRTIGGAGAGVTQEKSLLDWARIRLMLYGAKARPMAIRVRLVRLLDDALLPENSGTLVTNEQLQKNAFWYSYLKSLVAHPISGGSTPVMNKAMKVEWSKTYKIQPINTTDNDPDPSHVQVDLFRRLGLRLDYKGQMQSITYFTNGSVIDAGTTATDFGTSHINTRPAKARDNLYLLIDCNAYGATQVVAGNAGQAGDAEVSSTDAGSFDAFIEVAHKTLDTL